MEIVRIQHPETLEILQYRIDGKRVSQAKCNEVMQDMRGYSNSYTTMTKGGNFKHVVYLKR